MHKGVLATRLFGQELMIAMPNIYICIMSRHRVASPYQFSSSITWPRYSVPTTFHHGGVEQEEDGYAAFLWMPVHTVPWPHLISCSHWSYHKVKWGCSLIYTYIYYQICLGWGSIVSTTCISSNQMVSFRTDLLFFGALSLGIYIYTIYIYSILNTIIYIYQFYSTQANLTLPRSPPVFQAGLGHVRMLQREGALVQGLWQRAQLRFGVLMATPWICMMLILQTRYQKKQKKESNKYFVIAPVIFLLATNWISFLMAWFGGLVFDLSCQTEWNQYYMHQLQLRATWYGCASSWVFENNHICFSWSYSIFSTHVTVASKLFGFHIKCPKEEIWYPGWPIARSVYSNRIFDRVEIYFANQTWWHVVWWSTMRFALWTNNITYTFFTCQNQCQNTYRFCELVSRFCNVNCWELKYNI